MPKRGEKKRSTARSSTSETPAETGSISLEELVGYNLRRAHGVQRQRFAAAFGPHGIRPVQLSILGLVRDNPQIKQSVLGKALEIKRANIVALLDELEHRGLIVRRPALADRRAYVLELTPAGQKVTKELLRLHARLEADLVDRLGVRERDQLIKLLKKVRRLQVAPKLDSD
jgi:DNA-binding MarR family transcriptional regulator